MPRDPESGADTPLLQGDLIARFEKLLVAELEQQPSYCGEKKEVIAQVAQRLGLPVLILMQALVCDQRLQKSLAVFCRKTLKRLHLQHWVLPA